MRVRTRFSTQSLLLASISFVMPSIADAEADRPPPNILFVISDDLGWPCHGFLGNEIVETPNLDRLAAEGVTFPNGFSTSNVCAPALRSILTGLHPRQFYGWTAGPADPAYAIRRVETLPRLLAGAGYTSFQAGKFWEGRFSNAGFTTGTAAEGGRGRGVVSRAGGESAFFGRGDMSLLWSFLSEERPGPFFVWFAPMLPHAPYDADEHFAAPYRGLDLSPQAIDYYASITRFDAVLGRILDHLESAGLRRNTLVVYLSDNGYEMDPRESLEDPPLGGPRGKLSVHDLGFRTPVIFSWPGGIAQGRRSEHVVSAVDLFTTSLSAAGVDAPDGRMGHDLWPYLTGEGAFSRSSVIGHVSWVAGSNRADGSAETLPYSAYFVRTPEWRYIWHEESDQEQLFRIVRDPGEEKDLASTQPKLTKKLRSEASSWKETVMRRPARDTETGTRLEPRVQ